MKAVSTPTVISPRDSCQMPKHQMTNKPISVRKETVGENSDQTLFNLSLTARLCALASRKRAASRFSCANALTTRMPGMVSASTLVTSLHTRSIFSKPVRRRSRTRWIIQAMKGSGARVMMASHGFIDHKMTPVMMIISTSEAKSSKCSDRKTQMRSLPLPMRAIRSPVRLPPKNSSDSFIRCSYVAERRSAPMRSDTKAST